MPAIKEQAIKIIKDLPKNVSVEDILEELHFKMQVDKGIEQLDTGKSLKHEDVKKRLAKWLK